MKVVLGIDAAWVEKNPSGVALVIHNGQTWQCLAVASSYDAFIQTAEDGISDLGWQAARNHDSALQKIPDLIKAAKKLSGLNEAVDAVIDVVACDMPISKILITTRRKADQEISKKFGKNWCSTHSPTPDKPGKFGEDTAKAFSLEIAGKNGLDRHTPRLLEVYPHPALLALLNSPRRLKYKIGKKNRTVTGVLEEFSIIKVALERVFGPINLPIPENAAGQSLAGLKPYEDALDALICAWVGTCYIDGYAVPYGDENAAIWVPDKLTNLVTQIAKIPSFTTYEDRLLGLIKQYTSHLPVTVTRIPENNYIISWPGNNQNLRPVALTAHLDKINHFSNTEIAELPVSIEGDEIVGQLDDAVGVAICLHVLSECITIPDCPPILILLSEMEERGCYGRTELLKNGGKGIELSPGAHRISDYLLSQNMVPEAIITIDTSAQFRRTGDVAVYTDFWDLYGIDASQVLQAKTTELANRIFTIDEDAHHLNSVNDYVTYGMRFNESRDASIPSIAVEPAIWPIHEIGERMKIADINRVANILLELLRTWQPLRENDIYDHNQKAGNPGDVIKHTALIAATDAIMQKHKGPFHYADTFAGYAYNPIRTTGEWQNGIGVITQSAIKLDNAAVRFWQSLWQCDVGLPGSVYPGSSTFIRKLCLKNGLQLKASLWDLSPTVISQLAQAYDPAEANIFPRPAKIEDFSAIKPDLLLIDPPDFAAIDIAFFDIASNVILWLPVLVESGVETELSRQAHIACQDRGMKIATVRWRGEGKMQGCRLVFQLTPAAGKALTNTVLDTVSLMGWDADCTSFENIAIGEHHVAI